MKLRIKKYKNKVETELLLKKRSGYTRTYPDIHQYSGQARKIQRSPENPARDKK
jgi:hypothetical protein